MVKAFKKRKIHIKIEIKIEMEIKIEIEIWRLEIEREGHILSQRERGREVRSEYCVTRMPRFLLV